jgi:hypothetical protein
VINNKNITVFEGSTLVTIPSVINIKYIINSDGFFTGVLNLTIDKAPTIPKESAMLFDIADVITYPVRGKNIKVEN